MTSVIATRAARVNAVLPHSSEQIGLLHHLLAKLRDDAAFTAAVDTYLDERRPWWDRPAETSGP